ncbi:class I adenylate-forming enzyme family protein [Pseudoalteromonas sp. S1612]|uniref:AMP-binding protein n=1 Tax=Pseudoalteromonas sp. S1612 TaxID=579507 RepID=UPI0014872F05|nr:class I adenylate-forming enzyme family protein [Pseudoalteromonas sp. S1612]
MLNKLLDYINLVPLERCFIKAENRSVTYKQLNEITFEFIERYSFLKDKNCAVTSNDRLSLALYLPAIDSLAKTIFLQASDLDEDTTSSFYENAEIEYIITLKANNEIVIKKLNTVSVIEQSHGWLLATSGTTGTPKLVSFNLERLISTAQKNIELGSIYNWGLCYDLNRFAGLQVYLQVVAAGSVLTISESEHSISDIVNIFSFNQVNSVSATPSFWRKVLMTENASSLELKKITLGGEISTQSILNALQHKYSTAKITHIYASTEAGVGFAVKDNKEGFPANYLLANSELGISLKIINKELWIRSERSNSALLAGHVDIDEQGFINTGDLVECIDERVIFLGRSSGAINVGGNKVMPEKIEAIINQCNSVSYSRVFGKSNSMLGTIVCAEVVLEDSAKSLNTKDLKTNILRLCKDELETHEVPVLLKFVETIATNSTGKLIRF